MLQKGHFILLMLLAVSAVAFGQKTDRDYLRSGNKLYRDSSFVKAEVDYRKALEVNPKSTTAMYNLGNALLMQQKAKEAMEQYEAAVRLEKDKSKLAQMYHNMGVILQSSKKLPECIEAYKQSLRNNPHDNETRYNLALAQKQLKDQQQNQNQDKQQEQKQDQKQDDKQQNKDQQDQNKKDQQQNQQQNQNEMSKENAEQLLNAAMQDEKNVQDKVKKQIQIQGKKLDKDW
ncbi:tetratricopeptide repeat protein [uncultured Phocaeicola sp.]|jgi:tetratricopeptide (TPR) repeat protein|uniref:tetratricopeptide repeat protein n=1 Tax=uncultured Phocaeicola sp. TaxID=990718 RepID=UPI0025E24ECE|nr:tetratricopeptide repeat protein [uncultured Phocaeicola sp.]